MADFCKKCSEELFGEDLGDLRGLGNGRKLEANHYWSALCEGCLHSVGCQVDDEGVCHTRQLLEERGIYPDPDGVREREWEKTHART